MCSWAHSCYYLHVEVRGQPHILPPPTSFETKVSFRGSVCQANFPSGPGDSCLLIPSLIGALWDCRHAHYCSYQNTCLHSWLLLGSGGLNSGGQVCTASSLALPALALLTKRWLLISLGLLMFHFGSWPLLPSSHLLSQAQTISGHIPHLLQALSLPPVVSVTMPQRFLQRWMGSDLTESAEHPAHVAVKFTFCLISAQITCG